MITAHDGSLLSIPSRNGMVATTIQSTTASRPIRAARNWLTRVEKVLETSPRSAAARQFTLLCLPSNPAILSRPVG